VRQLLAMLMNQISSRKISKILLVSAQMIDNTRCITLYLSLWFSCPRFSRGYHAGWCVRHLLPKWRLLPKCVIAHVSWRGLHLLPKWRPTVLIKNRGHNFGWVRHLVLSIICGFGDRTNNTFLYKNVLMSIKHFILF
jgi:hypothetical protein